MFLTINEEIQEKSIILNAAFAAHFLEIILDFQKCQNAPLWVNFFDNLIRNYVARLVKLYFKKYR